MNHEVPLAYTGAELAKRLFLLSFLFPSNLVQKHFLSVILLSEGSLKLGTKQMLIKAPF